MKVGTDSIVLGSFAIHRLGHLVEPAVNKTALDIGCGSGLLALMLAQWSQGQLKITALDIDSAACHQARHNVASSPWPDSVSVVHQDAKQWLAEAPMKFDIMISNPPYFDVVQSPSRGFNNYSAARQYARSQVGLSLPELATGLQLGLASTGKAFVILPADSHDDWVNHLQHCGLYVAHRLDIASVANQSVNRCVYEVSKKKQMTLQQRLNVYTADRVYTEEYRQLCQAFYLNF
nr:methyltransferase [Alteromonas flava]